MQLAEKAGITPVTISRLEKTNPDAKASTVEALASALRFPLQFFYEPEVEEMDKDSVSFRSLKSMKAAERDAALAASSIAFLLTDWVDQRFRLPNPDLLDLSYERDPSMAARRLRAKWGLGEQPVGNMIDLLEAKGIRIFSLAEDTLNVDAYSFWRGDTPFVFLNTRKSAERSRLDAAHELGHLCLHRHGGPRHADAESEANAFAASFLMPEADVRSRILHINSLDQILRAKRRWGVSLSAMTYRLFKLGILSEWQSRRLFIEISKRGYRSHEPEPMPRESSLIWRTVFQELWKEKVTKSQIADELHIPLEELESVVFGLTSGQVRHDSALAQDGVTPKLIVLN